MPFLSVNLLKVPLSHGGEHAYLDFHKLQEQSAREQEFIATHQENWIHGLPQLYNVIEYEKYESTASNADYENGNKAEVLFGPKVVMNKVQPENLATRLSSLSSSYSEERTSKYAKEFKNDENSSPFSGLFHIPSFSYSFPGNKGPLSMSGYVYKAHVELNGITYVVGGLYENAPSNLRNWGIPRSTDLSRISVELKDKLPPYVNKEILMSPAMCENPNYAIFNPSRGTVTVYDISILGETSAGKLCQMYGTVVAHNRIFFCGGFEVRVDSVNFNQDIKRWIVKKSIKVNEFGYILDTAKMKMTKIHLKSKIDEDYNKRLGASLVSNVFSGNFSRHLGVTLPVGKPTGNAPYAAFLDLLAAEEEPQKLELKRETLTQKKEFAKPTFVTETTTLTTSINSSSATSRSTLRVTTDTSPQRVMTSASSSRSMKQGDLSSNSGGSPLSPTGSSTGNSLKVSSILQKSSRLFHRHSVRHNGQSQLRNASSYSNQVKHRRSNTLSSQNSRSTSPLRPSLKVPPPKQVADSVSLGSESTDTESVHSEQSVASSSPIATPIPKKLPPANLVSDLAAEVGSVGSGDNAAFFLEDSALRSGVISLSVYQFGGFKEVVSDSGELSFVATNELIKIELIIDDPEQVVFHSEAYMFELTNYSHKSVWPTPRGYFAHSLVSDDSNSAYCELVTPVEFQDSESSRSLTSAFEAVSSSEKSTAHHSYNADLFFETKALMIHGGVDENKKVHSDMYMFHFNTRRWLVGQTYAFDYYELPKKPYEDEKTELLTLERQVENPKLVEAELRCCHHQALLFAEDGREYVAFVGGFTNDFLRHHEETPYESDRFDVSRIARFLMSCTNSNLLRVPVLNLQSQTWKFSRFFYDLTGRVSPHAMDLLMGTDYLRNARMNVYGGLFSIVGKQITFCHGMVEFTPEKAEDFVKVKKGLGANSILMGGHCHLIFPSL